MALAFPGTSSARSKQSSLVPSSSSSSSTMTVLSSDTKRYASYGKRKVNAGSGTRHAEWMAIMGTASTSQRAAAASSPSEAALANQDVSSKKYHDAGLQMRAGKAVTSFPKTPANVPVNDLDHNNTSEEGDNHDDAKAASNKLRLVEHERRRVISISSESAGSSASDDRPSAARRLDKDVKKPRRVLRIVESPPSSPATTSSAAPPHSRLLQPALHRKDSNKAGPPSNATHASDTKKNAPKAPDSIDISKNALYKPSLSVENKENIPVPSTPALSPYPLTSTPARRPFTSKPSATTSSSLAMPPTIDATRRPAMHLPPPRGHGADASAFWRRPLTPLVPGAKLARYGAHKVAHNQRNGPGEVPYKPKRPPREMEPKSPTVSSRVARGYARRSTSVEVEIIVPGASTKRKGDLVGKKLDTPAHSTIPMRMPEAADDAPSTATQVTDVSSTPDHILKSATGIPPQAARLSRSTKPSPEPAASPLTAVEASMVEEAETSSPKASSAFPSKAIPSELSELVEVCASTAPSSGSSGGGQPHDFTSFVQAFPLFSALFEREGAISWTKLGEATYSEVFVATFSAAASSDFSAGAKEEVVVKVIPIHLPRTEPSSSPGPASLDARELPQTSLVKDVIREVEITQLLSSPSQTTVRDSEGHNGYTHLRGAYVARGSYPEALLAAWDTFANAHPRKSENPRPDVFPAEQAYLLLCLSHAGTDLESLRLRSWLEAASVLDQVSSALARAELSCNFEHRDMHWGNVLVRHRSVEDAFDKLNLNPAGGTLGNLQAALESMNESLQATIIDFTLSRADKGKGKQMKTLAGGLEDDAIFEGSGDLQYTCYRSMRKLVKDDDWEKYCPATNVVWLHYLTHKLLHDKRLKKPPAKKPAAPPKGRIATRGRKALAVPTPSKARSTLAETYEVETQAYEALKSAEALLKQTVNQALSVADGQAGPDQHVLGVQTRRSRSAKSSAASAAAPVEVGSAADFVAWWRTC